MFTQERRPPGVPVTAPGTCLVQAPPSPEGRRPRPPAGPGALQGWAPALSWTSSSRCLRDTSGHCTWPAEGRAAGRGSGRSSGAPRNLPGALRPDRPAASDGGKRALGTAWVGRAPAPEVTQVRPRGRAGLGPAELPAGSAPRWPATGEGVMPPSASGETAGPTPMAQCRLAFCPASPGPGGGTQPILFTAGP